MEEKKVMTHVQKGLLVSLILIIIDLAGYFTKLAEQSWYSLGVEWRVMYSRHLGMYSLCQSNEQPGNIRKYISATVLSCLL